jgi:hypothetical protein
MGKAAKVHRKKVAKRNANVKVQEKKMQKLWQEAFEEQMNVMKEKFASMSGNTNEVSSETMLNDTEEIKENLVDINLNLSTQNEENNLISGLEDLREKLKGEFSNEEEIKKTEEDFDKLLNLIKNSEKKESEEESEPAKPISGDQTV